MTFIERVLHEPLRHEVLAKTINVSRYTDLANEIADDVLIIDEVFPEDELDTISKRFAPYLADYAVFPFLGVLGGNVIGVGYGPSNGGRVYYYDFDFGIFELDETVEQFLEGLEARM